MKLVNRNDLKKKEEQITTKKEVFESLNKLERILPKNIE